LHNAVGAPCTAHTAKGFTPQKWNQRTEGTDMPITETEIETFAMQIAEIFEERIKNHFDFQRSGDVAQLMRQPVPISKDESPLVHELAASQNGLISIPELVQVDTFELMRHLNPSETLAVMNRVKEIKAGQRLVTQGNA
jgi:hypothetical protein